MKVEIEITGSDNELLFKKLALQDLATNVTKENLQFLAELSKIKNINEKLQSKKAMIKTFI